MFPRLYSCSWGKNRQKGMQRAGLYEKRRYLLPIKEIQWRTSSGSPIQYGAGRGGLSGYGDIKQSKQELNHEFVSCSRSSQWPTRTLKCFGLLWGLDLGQVSLKRVQHTKVIIINKYLVTADHMLNAFFFLIMLSYQVKESTTQLPVIPEEAILQTSYP